MNIHPDIINLTKSGCPICLQPLKSDKLVAYITCKPCRLIIRHKHSIYSYNNENRYLSIITLEHKDYQIVVDFSEKYSEIKIHSNEIKIPSKTITLPRVIDIHQPAISNLISLISTFQ